MFEVLWNICLGIAKSGVDGNGNLLKNARDSKA